MAHREGNSDILKLLFGGILSNKVSNFILLRSSKMDLSGEDTARTGQLSQSVDFLRDDSLFLFPWKQSIPSKILFCRTCFRLHIC